MVSNQQWVPLKITQMAFEFDSAAPLPDDAKLSRRDHEAMRKLAMQIGGTIVIGAPAGIRLAKVGCPTIVTVSPCEQVPAM